MALIDLKSDLSWYGKTPPKGVANNDKNITQFKYNTDLTVSVTPAGQLPRVSADGLPLENGASTRKAQLGEGTRFPIGPEGQIHKFDIKRTGWYVGQPYSAIYNNKVPFGLAASYTNNSPIDDMYNKFKVRDEAYDPFGYAKPPFILRGIQQDGESDPQRWGLAGTALANASMEVPRGGIVASVERAALDTVRLGKFLIRPQGLLFLAKQQLLHLMNPNTEDVTGAPVPGPQKLFNPANFLASAIGGVAGLRFKRWGVSPVGDVGKYEFIHTARNSDGTGITFNRLQLLNKQRESVANITPTWLPISAPLGPDSVGGIGATSFTKRTSHDTYQQSYFQERRYPGPVAEFMYRQETPYVPKFGKIIDELDKRDGNDADTALSGYMYILDPTRWTKKSLYSRRLFNSPGDESGASISQFNLTGLKTQLSFHDNNIQGLGTYDEYADRTFTYYGPYIGRRVDGFIIGNTINGSLETENNLNVVLYRKRLDNAPSESDEVFPVTGIPAQIAYHGNNIRGIGNRDEYDNRTHTYQEPYIGTQTDVGVTSDTISGDEERESDLISFVTNKTYGTSQIKTVDPENNSNTFEFKGGITQTEEQKIVNNRTAPDVIQNYRALTYGDIHRVTVTDGRRGAQNGQLIDFRTGQAWSTSDEYRKNTLENYYGYTPYNAANRKRAKPDPVNNSRYGDELSGVKDLIKFRFESVGFSGTNGKAIIFRAYINSLSDAFSPSWNPSQDQGRADPKVLYASFERTINVDFKVVVHSADEQHNVWDKLSALARNTYPVYAGSGFHGQFIRVTIGDLYVKQYMYVTSLTYDWDQDTPWEITEGVQLPMYTNVNMALNWVGTSKPKAEQIPYSYGGNRIPAVYADVPNNSGNDAYQGEADNSPTPAADDASLSPIPFDAPQEADTDTQAAAAPGTTTAR